MAGKATVQKSLLLRIPAVSVFCNSHFLASVSKYGFYHCWKLTQRKEKARFDSTCLFWLSSHLLHPSLGLRLWGCTNNADSTTERQQGFHMGIVGAVGHFPSGDVQGENNLIWLCVQFESAGLALKGEEDPSPSCWYINQSWNGTAEMQLVKHAETRYPVVLVLVPFPKGRISKLWYLI